MQTLVPATAADPSKPAHRSAQRIANLAESQTLALAKRVRELRAQGHDILSLTLGEPDFDTPAHIGAAAKQAIDEGFTHYPPVAGIPELRSAVAAFFQQQGIPSSASQVVVSTGAKQSLINVIMALVDPGEEVILVAPYWVSYVPMVKMAEGVPVIIQTTAAEGLKLTPAQLRAHITPRTRLIILNSPGNPHGAMYSRAELEALAEVLRQHPQVFVLSDEIYAPIAYDQPHVPIASLPGMAERTVTVSGVSKAFAMTGWRIGFASGPQWIMDLCEKFQGQITSGANSIAQKAAAAGVGGDPASTQHMVEAFRRRRDLLVDLCRKDLPGWRFDVPPGAFYLFPDVSAAFGKRTPSGAVIQSCDDYAEFLLTDALVSVVPGSAFGSSTHIRLSYACSEDDLREAVRRISAAVAGLR